MYSAVLLLGLIAVDVTDDPLVVEDHVDIIELNYCLDHRGNLAFRQLIFFRMVCLPSPIPNSRRSCCDVGRYASAKKRCDREILYTLARWWHASRGAISIISRLKNNDGSRSARTQILTHPSAKKVDQDSWFKSGTISVRNADPNPNRNANQTNPAN